MTAHLYPIKTVSLRTGLSVFVIRVWERRYGAVEPQRTETNRRRYSEEQIERLVLLRKLTQSGHNIGFAARLPTATLRKMASETGSAGGKMEEGASVSGTKRLKTASSAAYLERCIVSVKALDGAGFEATLREAETVLGAQGMLRTVAGPLAQAVGDFWREGEITAAHEHFCSAGLRTWLSNAARPYATAQGDPALVVTTPAGQVHELGALLVAASASNLGWHVIYLGPSLPAAEIAGAAKQNQVRVVALSLVYPEDDARLPGELLRLRELLPEGVKIVVGGRATNAYRQACRKIGAIQVGDLRDAGEKLDQLRKASTGRRAC